MWAKADLFSGDILEVLETKEPLTTPMILSFEISSQDKCAEANDGLLPALQTAYGLVESLGCDRIGFDTVAIFRVPVEIVYEAVNDHSDSDQPLYIGVYEVESNDILIGFFQNTAARDTFYGNIPEELTRYAGSDLTPMLSATIQNDTRDVQSIGLTDVFADGRPLPVNVSQDFELMRRGEVEVTLSDVSNAALAIGYSHVPIGILRRASP